MCQREREGGREENNRELELLRLQEQREREKIAYLCERDRVKERERERERESFEVCNLHNELWAIEASFRADLDFNVRKAV